MANLNAEKLRKLKAQPGYEQNLPADVRSSNDEKVRDASLTYGVHLLIMLSLVQLSTYEAEVSNLLKSMETFSLLK